jgi:hypothetical protein
VARSKDSHLLGWSLYAANYARVSALVFETTRYSIFSQNPRRFGIFGKTSCPS